MKKLACTVALLLMMTSISNAEEIYLKTKDEIAMALKLHNSLAKVSSNVTSCLDTGSKHLICLCKNRNVILEFNKMANSAFKKYPLWLKHTAVNFKDTNGMSIIIVPVALQKQASQELNCD